MALDKFQPYLFVSAGEQSNKYLTPVITNGIAQFQAQRVQDLTGLKVRIDPIQEGSGDPSPTNIRPISGRTGLTVTRMGNILGNVTWVDNFVINAQGVISTNNGLRYSSLVPVVIGESYAFLYDNIAGTNYNTRIHGYDSTGAWVQQIVVSSTGNNTGRFRADFTIPSGISYIRVSTGMESGIHAIALGASTNYPITWETEAGTIYGGTLDVVSGVLTVDTILATISSFANENANWSNDSTIAVSSGSALAEPRDSAKRARAVTNMLPNAMGYGIDTAVGSQYTTTPCFGFNANDTYNRYLYARFPKTIGTTLAEVNAYLAENPLVLTYAIQTPQTYNITPEDIKTLAGFNQIYSDAGPVIDIKF